MAERRYLVYIFDGNTPLPASSQDEWERWMKANAFGLLAEPRSALCACGRSLPA